MFFFQLNTRNSQKRKENQKAFFKRSRWI
jgi:hypothetical protein